jgi:uncharacterized protein YpmB
MKKEISTPVAIVLIVIVVVLVAIYGYKKMNPYKSNVTPQQQIEMMKHMKIGPGPSK